MMVAPVESRVILAVPQHPFKCSYTWYYKNLIENKSSEKEVKTILKKLKQTI